MNRTRRDVASSGDVLRDSVRIAMPPEGLESFVKKFRRTVDDVVDLYSNMIQDQFSWVTNIVDNHIRIPDETTSKPAQHTPQVSADKLSALPPTEEPPTPALEQPETPKTLPAAEAVAPTVVDKPEPAPKKDIDDMTDEELEAELAREEEEARAKADAEKEK